MRKYLLAFGFIALVMTQAQAYSEGTFRCKNTEGLPPNVYTIKKVDMGQGVSAPYVEITRYFKAKTPTEAPIVTHMKGFAAHATSTESDLDILMVGAIRIEWINGRPFNCKE